MTLTKKLLRAEPPTLHILQISPQQLNQKVIIWSLDQFLMPILMVVFIYWWSVCGRRDFITKLDEVFLLFDGYYSYIIIEPVIYAAQQLNQKVIIWSLDQFLMPILMVVFIYWWSVCGRRDFITKLDEVFLLFDGYYSYIIIEPVIYAALMYDINYI